MKIHPNPISGHSPAPNHFAFLDGIRACAAIYVLLHHAFMYVPAVPEQSVVRYLTMPFTNGHSAVNVFIVISGFCLMYPLLANNFTFKGGISLFYIRRAKRILPPYFITILICLGLASTIISVKTGTQWDGTLGITRWDVIARVFLLQDVFADTNARINYSLWSIAVECRIYLLFPIIVYSWKKLGGTITTIAAIALSLILWQVMLPYKQLNFSRSGINIHYLALFIFGSASAYLSHAVLIARSGFSKFPLLKIAGGTIILLALLTVLKHYVSAHSAIPQFVLNDLRQGTFTAFLLVLLCNGKLKWLNQILSATQLTSIGLFSYTIYLLHPPLLQIFTQYFLQPLQLAAPAQVVLMVCFGCPFVLGCTYFLFSLVERPFMHQHRIQIIPKLKMYSVQLTLVVLQARKISSDMYWQILRAGFLQLKNWP